MVVSCRRDDGAPHPDRMINYSKHGARYLRYLLHDGQALSYENCKYLEHSVPKTSSECRLPSRALFSIALPRSATTVAWPLLGQDHEEAEYCFVRFLVSEDAASRRIHLYPRPGLAEAQGKPRGALGPGPDGRLDRHRQF